MTISKSPLRSPIARVRGLGSAKSGTEHFWMQRVTGAANLLLTIATIIIVLKLVGRDYSAAMDLLGRPIVAITLLLFILSATFHMRLGMQVIIEDYVHGGAIKLVLLAANTFFSLAIAVACGFSVLKLGFGI